MVDAKEFKKFCIFRENSALDWDDYEIGQINRFVNDFFDMVHIVVQPISNLFYESNSHIKSMGISVETKMFDSYEEMKEFILVSLNNYQFVVYTYQYSINHKLRFKLIDKNINLIK